jgi:hypothetical protein
MTSPDQIKAIATDFLRALATVPGLLARWHGATSNDLRAEIVRAELGLQQTFCAADIAKLSRHTASHAQDVVRAKPLLDVAFGIVLTPPALAESAA